MRLPSELVYGFKANDIEDVRAMLERTLGITFEVSRNDDAGIRYEMMGRDSVPTLGLFPNHDEDEDGTFHPVEAFKDYPVILSVIGWEKMPNIMEVIASIPGLDAEFLKRREEEEVSIDDLDDD